MGVDNRRSFAGGKIEANPRHKAEGQRREQQPKGRIYVAIDIESTGVEADTGEIIEVAALRFRLEKGGRARVLEEWQTFVRPQNPIPYKITNLTGIRQSDVEHAPSFNQIRERLRQFLGNYPIIGHSVESDIGFLRRHQFEVQNPALDTYELATLVMPQHGNYSLKAVAEALDVQADTAHRAMADARMTMEVFSSLVGRVEQLPPEILREVDRAASQLLGEWSLHTVFRDAIEVQKEEEDSVGAVSNLGALLKLKLEQSSPATKSDDLGFLFLVEEEKQPELQSHPIHPDHLSAIENRVTVPIREAFSENRPLLLEVPGGQSGSEHERAYGMLVAAVEQARRTGQSVILGTSGDTKRERMINQIVPELQEKLSALENPVAHGGSRKRRQEVEKPFKVAVVKNQTNYLCLRRWENFRKTESLTDDELKLLIKVLIWLPNTTEGDSSELRIGNSERLWSRINSQKGLCLPEFCDRDDQPRCFYYRARERAQASHVALVDQSLVMADLVGQAGTLPHSDYIILDDAHQLEDEASRQFGTVISPYSLFNFLDWLSRPITWKAGANQERNGFLHSLANYYKKDTGDEVKTLLEQVAEETSHQVDLSRDAAGNFLRELSNILLQHNQETGQADGRVRLDARFRHGPVWAESVGLWEVFHHQWEELYYRLAELRDEAQAVQTSLSHSKEFLVDISYYVNQCNYLLNKLTSAFESGENGQIFWMAATRLHANSSAAVAVAPEAEGAPLAERAGVSIYSAPLEVAPVLEQRLFNPKKSVALVSSTLTTENDFNFIKDRLGLEHSNSREVRLTPARDYSSTLLFLPGDMPEPNQPGYQKGVDQHIMELARLTEGRMVVIFSSNSALRLTYKAVQRSLESQNILVLGQGLDGSRRSMMGRFRSTPRAVMLTTLNYWDTTELQNSPGSEDESGAEEGLFNLLVITKLPFDPPSDPVFAARVESKLFERPFEQYGLPRTILRFRQTFERLLAGQPERGAVVMLDSRLTSKSYGSLFLNSLPPLTTRHNSLNQMSSTIKDWLS
ncbi:MAG TPA: exonuclease domain-containing protein [Chloroflexia bacterium]|nr:exonuclease domain-containing protein [Chloroflexia bacterium]